MPQLTYEIAKEFLSLDVETGRLFWIVRDLGWFKTQSHWKTWNTQFAGKEAFTAGFKGYRVGQILRKRYQAHRIVWLLNTGEMGVHWCSVRNKWVARITVQGRRKSVGTFDKFSDAVVARKAAEKNFGFHQNHGKELR